MRFFCTFIVLNYLNWWNRKRWTLLFNPYQWRHPSNDLWELYSGSTHQRKRDLVECVLWWFILLNNCDLLWISYILQTSIILEGLIYKYLLYIWHWIKTTAVLQFYTHFQISHASHMASNYIPAESNADRLQENLNQRSGDNLIYSINDRPPWYLCLLLGFQVRTFFSHLQ